MTSSKSSSSAPQKPLPFYMQFMAGGLAGVSEILVMYPLDVVKTRFQLQVGNANAGSNSIIGTLKTIVQTEGPTRLYRGIIPPIFIEAPKRATKFAANAQYGQFYRNLFQEEKMTQKLSILTGVSAGVTEAFIVSPPEMIKVRMQDKNNAGKYKSTFDVIRKVYAEEGFLAFTKGLEATLWRHAVWNGGYFGVIFGVRKALPEAESESGVLFRNFIAGSIGGTFGTILNTPPDVIKTRMQNQIGAGPHKYNWTIPSMVTVAREEGMGALYKGFLPKVLRLGPGGGILLVVFDKVSKWMRANWL